MTASEPNSYVALLRGINVSGQKKIRMQDLRELCESIGLKNVATYVQSGNVVFGSPEPSSSALVASIEDAIRSRFGFEVPVILRTQGEIEDVVGSNPFVAEQGIDEQRLAVVFLAALPTPDSVAGIDPPGPSTDRFEIVDRHVYLHCPGGFARTKLSNNFFENKLRLAATTRNWKTVNALNGMLHEG